MAQWTAQVRSKGWRTGFVPTMGALHAGHLSLLERALQENERVVCSIFVNPLQFNNAADLAHYPRQLEKDRELLERAGCHALFVPEEADIFAGFTPRPYAIGDLNDLLEGPLRPGHFQGMLNVVERLFFHVRPESAYFGEKDRQQLAIIRRTAAALRWPERIVGCPTRREEDGLAMSSRNQRLGPEDRQRAPVLFRALSAAAEAAFERSVGETQRSAEKVLAQEPTVVVDYFSIAHPDTLAPLDSWEGLEEAVALVAAQVGPVRLIDNMTLRR